MGDRDYRSVIKGAIDSIGREITIQIDNKDFTNIYLHEITSCIRRAYYNRMDPIEQEKTSFSDLLGGLLRKMQYGAKDLQYDLDGIKLNGRADMIVDDAVIIFRSADSLPEVPPSSDLLYLNASLWIFNKFDGVLIYLTGDRKEVSFSLTRNNKMFEELVRRARVLSDLLEKNKTPILEPSTECADCQYYSRCFIDKKLGRSVSLKEMVGLKK